MKFRRSERLIDITHYLLEHPRQLVPLTFFAERYGSAKSSISEDLAIVKETFEQRGIGTLQTVPGAAGGVKYFPRVNEHEARQFIANLCDQLENPERLLPGEYLYIMDLLGNPQIVHQVGKLIASAYAGAEIDAVMTVATKGIPIAHAIAAHLNVPVVVVRRDSKVTEGPTVSINYVSGSTKRIQTMVLAKRSLKEGSKVLLVDDFMKAGGTINGMISLLAEFNATVAGIAVLVEAEYNEERLVEDYISLMKLKDVDIRQSAIKVVEGNYFTKNISFL
ncbi:pur operon repressor [Bacillus thermotolerans]|uniref:PurR: transcription regulator associated with purine metabolism n=1 Tax=Bacillus thermotolerans TaxID=1221996 RepID=A0A0F5HQH4_BACTR|nr:pur operon repressor [Bacillus thermotolerans]KKB35295.1 PurR: transcription regulator associated with purine metabolism [Bacillus thermotolerans]KKB39397.1 PurR: transcription regulator associated with purine metabolism [Bacillus thermotolerans]KKB42808.1 PurR: transcription regulator associated with purine metabolism [Bacillus thermotolerans]